MPTLVKYYYGKDPLAAVPGGNAFYWSDSEQKRSELRAVKRGSPSDFEAIYQCRPGNRSGVVFLESDFAYYQPPENLFLGIASPHVQAFVKHGQGVFQAWDTAASTTSTAAWTVCTTGLFAPCTRYHRGEDPALLGSCDSHFDVLILDVFREKVGWGDLNNAFRIQTRKWQPDLSLVEDRSTGISLLQSFEGSGFRIKGVAAKEGKRERAIKGYQIGGGVGSVQGWCRMHRVLFPENATWFPALKIEMKDFSGNDDSTSDQVDSLVHLVTHAIVQGASAAILPSDWTPERGTAEDQEDVRNEYVGSGDPRADFLMMLGELGNHSYDPYSGLCGRCVSYEGAYCMVHRQPRVALDSCAAQEDRTNHD